MPNVKKMMNDFDHDWHDVSVFEKIPVRKTAGKAKRVEHKKARKAARVAKRNFQEYHMNTHNRDN